MDESLKIFYVSWEHGPAPGLAHYSGKRRIVAPDAEEAGHRLKQQLKSESCFEPSCITIKSTEVIG